MKKIKYFLLALVFTISLNAGLVLAHPGRTDSRGGHHCWTNCNKWGYKYGSWHKHNNGKSNKSKTKTSKKSAKKKSKKQSKR